MAARFDGEHVRYVWHQPADRVVDNESESVQGRHVVGVARGQPTAEVEHLQPDAVLCQPGHQAAGGGDGLPPRTGH
jgi:hypothetical protein